MNCSTVIVYSFFIIFFFKQKTAYEMRISDWSSDVCSSDLRDAVFQEVCTQIARSGSAGVPERQHLLAVATQRTSRSISGPYQDVLQWAHMAETGAQFCSRLSANGVANQAMREFVATFRANLVTAGIAEIGRAHVCTQVTNAHIVCR